MKRRKSIYPILLVLCIWFIIVPSTGAIRTESIFNFTRSFYFASMPENARGRVYAVPQDGKMGVYLPWTITAMPHHRKSDLDGTRITDNTTSQLYEHQQSLVRFRIVSGDKHNYFKVESEIVGNFAYLRIRTRSSLDVDLNREVIPEFSLRIKAVYRRHAAGGGGRNLETRTEVLLKITDQNDLSPVFLPEYYRFVVERRKTMFSSLGRVTASDADYGLNGEVYYQLMNRTDYFAVHPTSGVITLIKPLPVSSKIFNFSIAAVDRASRLFSDSRSNQGMANLAKVDIEVVDTPAPNSVHFWHVSSDFNTENEFRHCGLMADGLCAILTRAMEKIGLGRFYSGNELESDDEAAGYFYVQRLDNGGKEDYEYEIRSISIIPTGVYNLTFSNAPNVLIRVNQSTDDWNCDDQVIDMWMNKSEYTFDVPEWAPDNYVIGDIRLHSNVGRVRFDLRKMDEEIEMNLPFMITPETGLLYLKLSKNETLNYKRRSSYEFFVHARPMKCTEGEEKRKILIRIKDCNDHAPRFVDNCDRLIFKSDRMPSGNTILCKFMAVDDDVDDNGRVYYDLVPNPTSVATVFHLDHERGELTLKNASTFFTSAKMDRKKSYSFVVRAFDHGLPLRRVSEKTVIVSFNDSATLGSGETDFWTVESGGNESLELIHPSQHSPNVASEWSFEVAENAPIGFHVGTVEASDLDKGYAGILLFSIDGNEDSGMLGDRQFNIDLYNGSIYVFRALDREKKDQYSLKISISDLGIPSRRTSTKVLIKILDINDNSPKFEKSAYRVRVKEDAEIGLAVLQLKATDDDSETNGRIRYSLATRTPYFNLDPDSGILTLKASLDREKFDRHRLLVKAQDYGQPSLSAFVNVTVVVEDVNDNVPMCRIKSMKAYVPEDYPADALVTCIDADDADIGENGVLSYRLIDNTKQSSSADPEAPFFIDSLTGCIRLGSATNSSTSLKHRKGLPNYLELLLDYERQPFYNLTVELMDSGKSRQLRNTCHLFVEVLDVNENRFPPKFVDYSSHGDEDETIFATEAEIHENELAPTFVKQVKAYDADASVIMVDAKPIYSIVDGDGLGVFTIDRDGRIQTTRSLDRETKPFYWLTIMAQDRAASPLSSTIDVFVRVLDRNDNPPMPSKAIYYASVKENSPPNTVVLRIDATDADSLLNEPSTLDDEETNENADQAELKASTRFPTSPLTYKITRGDPQSFFKIDSKTGYISTDRRSLDRETTPELELEVTISDNGEPEPLVSTVTVMVSVDDENDHAPTFPTKMLNFDIPSMGKRKQGQGKSNIKELFLCRIFAYDEDEGENGEIRYSITEGNEQRLVKIDAETGDILALEGSTWNHDQPLIFVVRATDNGIPAKYTERTVHLNVIQDTTDTKYSANNIQLTSDFESTPLHVAASDAVGHSVGLVEATLANGDGQRIWYYLRGGNDDNTFALRPDTGMLLLAKKPTASSYFLTFFATVDGVSGVDGKISVIVQPAIDDERPQFSMVRIAIKVPENQSVNSLLLRLPEYLNSSYDREEIRFFVSENYYTTNQSPHDIEGMFQVDPKSGAVFLKQALDREHQAKYSFKVGARSRRGKRGYAMIDVQVLDINDHSPRFVNRHIHVRISQMTNPGTVIHRLAAFDADEGVYGRLTYTLVSGYHKDAFEVDAQTGAIRVTRSLVKLESSSEFVLTVKVEDGGQPPLYDMANVRIVLTAGGYDDDGKQVNGVLKFTQDTYTFRVLEKLPVGALIGNVQIDGGFAVEYAISDDGGYFNVHPLSGAVILRKQFDFQHSVQVEATVKARRSSSAAATFEATAKIIVALIDGNDHAPVFKKLFYETSVDETAPVGTVLLQVEASDADAGQAGFVTYHIVDSWANQYFGIDYHTGAIRLLQQLDYDNEKQRRFEFSVAAEDLGQPKMFSSRPALVEINVLDANDSPPIFDQKLYEFVVYTPSAPGVEIGKVFALDKDTVGVVTYGLRQSPGCKLLNIGKHSGIIRLSSYWNDTTGNLSFPCTISATDGTHEAIVNGTVKVTPSITSTANMRFENDHYEVSIPENSSTVTPGTVLLRLRVLNIEADEPVSFAILNFNYGTDESSESYPYVSLHHSLGHLMTTEYSSMLDRESTPYLTYVVEAKMIRRPTALARTLIAVHVLDENDNAPRFVGLPYAVSVPVNIAKNTSVFRPKAVDLDEGINAKVKYSLANVHPQIGFHIDEDTGEIFAVGDLFRIKESGLHDMKIMVVATDQGIPAHAATALIDVRLVSTSTPVFPTSTFNVSVLEGPRGVGSTIFESNSFDISSSVHSVVGYTLIENEPDGFQSSAFDLDFTSGRLVLRKPLDRRFNQMIPLKIRAKDYALNVKDDRESFSDATIMVHILDDNNHAPVFEKPLYVVNVKENALVGAHLPLLTLQAVDGDEGINSQFTFALKENDDHSEENFRLDLETGILTLAKRLDFETRKKFELTAIAKDFGSPSLSSTAKIIVHVLDVNDNPPAFTQSAFEVELRSSTLASGQFVGQASALDPDECDRGQLRYSILSGNDEGWFVIDQTSGVLRVSSDNSMTDLSMLSMEYSLNLTVTDGVHSASCRFLIKINSGSSKAAKFVKNVYQARVKETASIGTFITEVRVEDRIGIPALRYRLVGSSLFRIEETTGKIFTARQLDSSTKAVYSLTILAEKWTDFTMATHCQLQITVISENNRPPKFLADRFSATVSPETKPNTIILKLRALDLDRDDILEYSFDNKSPSNFDDYFFLDFNTGALAVRRSLDSVIGSVFKTVVRATDRGNPPQRTTAPLEIRVVSQSMFDTNVASFSRLEYIFTVREDANVGTEIGRLDITERHVQDLGSSKQNRFSISTPRSIVSGVDWLNLDDKTGSLKIAERLDREVTTELQFYVSLHRMGTQEMSTMALVRILVEDVDDNGPIFENASDNGHVGHVVHVSENAPIGSLVTIFVASDPDSGEDGRVTYWLEESDTALPFEIDSYTGWLRTALKLDRETVDKYTFQVLAGSSNAINKATQNVTVMVMDANDQKPVFEKAQYEFSLENGLTTLPGFVIGRVFASDADLPPNNEIRYYLTSGNERNLFDIRDTGEIYLTKKFDITDWKSDYQLTVLASDGLFEDTSIIKVHIPERSLIKCEINATVCQKPRSFSIREDANIGKTIGQLDKLPNGYVYQLTDVDTLPDFTVSKIGEITVFRLLDYESRARYDTSIEIRFEDAKSASSCPNIDCLMQLTIILEDINDCAPKFDQDVIPNEISITENYNGTSPYFLGRVHAADADSGLGGQVHYRLSVDGSKRESDLFTIDSVSGALFVWRALDREEKESYNLTVIAEDGGRPKSLSSQMSIVIKVLDVNDNPPVFMQTLYDVSAPEDTPTGVVLVHVEAISADVGENARIAYTLEKTNGSDVFEINERTGEVRLKRPLDYETTKEHVANVKATDGGQPPLSAYVRIRLRVVDVNDNDPIFERRHYTLQVPENATTSSRLLRILATDLDSDKNGLIEYRIEPANPYFRMATGKAEAGWIILSDALDYEKSTRHEFQVMAYDQGKPQRSSVAVVTVEVIDVNDNQPRILNCNRTLTVKAHAPKSTPLFHFQVSDADGPSNAKPFHFSIISSAPATPGQDSRSDESLFRIDTHGALFASTTPLDSPEYHIPISVRDSGDPPLSSQCRLHIRVTDESRFPPRLVNSSFVVLSYLGEMGSGGVVGRVLALDDDPKDTIRYAILNVTGPVGISGQKRSDHSNSIFSIDPDDGRISAAAELQLGEYHLYVSASDGRFETSTIINVNIRSITTKMLDSAVSLRVAGFHSDTTLRDGHRHRQNPELFDEHLFVERHMKSLTRAVASAVNARSAQYVHILSVQKATDSSEEQSNAEQGTKKLSRIRPTIRRRRSRNSRAKDEVTKQDHLEYHGVDILIVVQKSHHHDFFKPEYVRKTLEHKLDDVERSANVKIVSLVTEMCRSDHCKNGGVCRERLHLYDGVSNAILTETYSFVSPTHRRWAECVCAVGFGGQFCEQELNDCAKRPCPIGHVCVAKETNVNKKLENEVMQLERKAYRCLCTGIGCPNYDSVHMVSPRSWIRYTISENLEISMQFSIVFRTVARSGILLYTSGRSDYQTLELFGGQLRYRYDLGDGETLLYIDGRPSVDDGIWHTVHVERNRRMAKLTLDNRRPQTVNSSGDAFVLNLHGADMYLGSDGTSESGFVGCLKDVTLNGDALPWHGAGIQMFDVDVGQCADSDFKRILAVASGTKNTCGWCLNNGTCITGDETSDTAWSCICPMPFTGLRCEAMLPKFGVMGACLPSPCQNGGTCVLDKTSITGFRCRCPLGFSGRTCSIFGTDPCDSSPCANGAMCVEVPSRESDTGFYCNCTAGWTGQFCRQMVTLQPPIVGGIFGVSLPELIGIVAVFLVLILLTVVIVLLCRRQRAFRRKKYLQRRGPSMKHNHGESEPMFSESDVTPSTFAQRSLATNMFVSGGPCGAMAAVSSDPNSVSTPVSPATCSASYGNIGHGPPPLPPRSRGFQPHRGSKLSNLESALSTGIPTVQVRPLSMSERQTTPVEGGLARATAGGYLETAANYGSAAEELEKLGRRTSPTLDDLEDWKAALNRMNADSLEKLKEAAGITDEWHNDGSSGADVGHSRELPSMLRNNACDPKIRCLQEEERSSGKSGAYNWDYSDWNSTIGHHVGGDTNDACPYGTISHLSIATDDDYGTGTLPRGVCRLEETDTEYAGDDYGNDDQEKEDQSEVERQSRLRGDEFTKELIALTKSFGKQKASGGDLNSNRPILSTFKSPTGSSGSGGQSYLDRYLPKPVEPPNSTASERKLLVSTNRVHRANGAAAVEQFSDDDEEFTTPSSAFQSSLLDTSRLSEITGRVSSDGEKSMDSVIQASSLTTGSMKRKDSMLIVSSISDDEEENNEAKLISEGNANNRTFVKKSKKHTQV